MKIIAEDVATIFRVVEDDGEYGAPSIFEVFMLRFGDEVTLSVGRGEYTLEIRKLINDELKRRGITTWRFARIADGKRRIISGKIRD